MNRRDPEPDDVAAQQQILPAMVPASWHFLLLVEIANFAALRRQIGRLRADRLAADVADRIARVLTPVGYSVAGRATIELTLLGYTLADVHDAFGLLSRTFAEPLELDGEQHRIEFVMAAAGGPAGVGEDVRLIEEAEHALVQARTEHRPVVHDVTCGVRSLDMAVLTRDLAQAIEREEVFLQYQPKLHVRRQTVTSAEALVRWNHPTRGLILPNDFIPLAEDTQLIGPLTLWTLRRVIADRKQMVADGYDIVVFINISGQLLGDRRFVAEACKLIADSDARVGFEITETSMIRDPDIAVTHLKIIAAAGVPIAIDDYGSGLSSLAYLKKLPATELKIDKMFVMELTSSHRDPLIVRSTIDLAHAMEMEVTAEGVETPAALALLSVMGCDQVQGFLLSRPLSLLAFRQYLSQEDNRLTDLAVPSLRRPNAFWTAA